MFWACDTRPRLVQEGEEEQLDLLDDIVVADGKVVLECGDVEVAVDLQGWLC